MRVKAYSKRNWFVAGVQKINYESAEILARRFFATTVREARRILAEIKRGLRLPLMVGSAALTVDVWGDFVLVDNWND